MTFILNLYMGSIHVVLGPTASGKSLFSVNLAESIKGEIISADTVQIYKDFNIGTGKISPKDMNNIPHHLIGTQDPSSAYSVQQFIQDVDNITAEIERNNRVPIVCGGAAMYLKAYLYGYEPLKRLPQSQTPDGTKDELWDQLNKIDPDLAKKTPKQNKRRVQRYLELYEIYKEPPSTLFKQHPLDTEKFKVTGIMIEINDLTDKINARVDQMIINGLIDEVESLMKKYDLSSPPFQAIGYKEVVNYLQGGSSKDFMINAIKSNTRNYAKRQMTWFRTFDNVKWISQ